MQGCSRFSIDHNSGSVWKSWRWRGRADTFPHRREASRGVWVPWKRAPAPQADAWCREAEAAEGEGAEGAEVAAEGGDKPVADGDKKEGEDKKPAEEKK